MECKYCLKECNKYGLKNHEIYCLLNPERKDKSGKNNPMYGKSSNASNQYIKARELGISINITEETRQKIGDGQRGKIWSQEAKDKHKVVMSKTAKENPDSYSAANVNGRVKKIDYNGISLDGSWELLVVQWLDSNNIKWIRNTKGFKYEWNGIRTYYPDFYLPDYDKFIEVKGYTRERDLIKWKSVENLIVIDKTIIKLIKNNTFKI